MWSMANVSNGCYQWVGLASGCGHRLFVFTVGKSKMLISLKIEARAFISEYTMYALIETH